MPPPLQKLPGRPLLYLITSGETTVRTTAASEAFANVLQLIQSAVAAGIDLVQIREKNLSASVLYQLSASAARITQASATKLLVNDRSDIAVAAAADGVHLTTASLPASAVREAFGAEFIIGVSTHSLAEAGSACRSGADFLVFGPVFDTASKSEYGEPAGIENLARVCSELSPFPVLALGGVTTDNAADCIHAGAAGIAAIRLLNDRLQLDRVVNEIHEGVGNR
ncbi:MAG TPA: thiamine phosphate synthase [Pyrinomonadaceae bacterium]|jgi:thiamine-phosphate pyrophosphorylase|nr:thiamine phosphate synthase [Pyrinomonadaceae bacterium]